MVGCLLGVINHRSRDLVCRLGTSSRSYQERMTNILSYHISSSLALTKRRILPLISKPHGTSFTLNRPFTNMPKTEKLKTWAEKLADLDDPAPRGKLCQADFLHILLIGAFKITIQKMKIIRLAKTPMRMHHPIMMAIVENTIWKWGIVTNLKNSERESSFLIGRAS